MVCFNCHSPRDIAEAISDTHVNLCVTLSDPQWPVPTVTPPGAMLNQIQKYVPVSGIKWPVAVVTPLPGALLKQSVYIDYWFTDTITIFWVLEDKEDKLIVNRGSWSVISESYYRPFQALPEISANRWADVILPYLKPNLTGIPPTLLGKGTDVLCLINFE